MPEPAVRDALTASLRGCSPAPLARWDGRTLTVEYAFPAIVFGEIRKALRIPAIEQQLNGVERARLAWRALLEANEREFLEHPGGWRPHVDRLYLACAAAPIAGSRRGALWRKHERSGDARRRGADA